MFVPNREQYLKKKQPAKLLTENEIKTEIKFGIEWDEWLFWWDCVKIVSKLCAVCFVIK